MSRILYLAILAACANASAPDVTGIPTYLQTGIEKFRQDAGTLHVPQSELLIALVLTGHAGENIHSHRMQLHRQAFPSGPDMIIKISKTLVISSMGTIFDAIQDSHRKILAQTRMLMPTPNILMGIAQAITQIKVAAVVCERLAMHPNPAIGDFYKEMAAVLNRAIGLKTYLAQFGYDNEMIDNLEVLNAAGNAEVDKAVGGAMDGYTRLASIGSLDGTFVRTEFSHIWE
jgi:hypothetical protein